MSEAPKRSRPSDWKAREDAVISRGRNLVVEASAGTGKTQLLVDRATSFAAESDSMEHMAVVTFTESAAAELRSRIRLGLHDMDDPGRGRDALRRLPSAFVGTIHGFASKVLRDYFHLTQVDPSFSAGRQAFPGIELERLWDRYLGGLPGETVVACADLLLLCRGLPAIAQQLACTPWVEWPQSFIPPGESGRLEREHWLTECRKARSLVDRAGAVDDLSSSLLGVCPELEGLLSSAAGLADIGAVTGGILLKGGYKAWPSRGDYDDAKRIAKLLRESLAGDLLTGQFGSLVWPFVEQLRRLRGSDRSALTFDDLLYRCQAALEAQPRLLELVAERYRLVMIDEFQDTSGIQARLFATFLSRDGRIAPGSLTVVGDPKQSIYGWREADIETFKGTLEDLERDGALKKTIDVSNRSTRSIVGFVNAFGEALFADPPAEEGRFACPYSPLVPHPDAAQGSKVTVAWTQKFENAPNQMRIEASWLASFLLRETAGGREADGWAILFRSMTHADTFIKALEDAGLPWCLDSSRDFRGRAETTDLRTLLKLLLSPSDRSAFCTVLRSPVFGVPDGDITLSLAGGGWTYLDPPAGIPSSVVESCGLLRSLRKVALTSPPAELLQAVLYGTCFAAVIAGSRHQPARRLSNLRYVLGLCLSGGVSSTADLLEGLEEEGQGPVTLEKPSAPPSARKKILLGTVHGSKGLTYGKVVFVATQREGGHANPVRMDEKAGIASVSFGGISGTPYTADIKASSAQRENAEKRRLAYVAVTRAAERLVVMAHSREKDASGFLPKLVCRAAEAALREAPDCTESVAIEAVEMPPPPKPAPALLRDAAGPVPVPRPVEAGPAIEEEESPEMRLGSAVHSILEKIDLKDPEGWLERNGGSCIVPHGVDAVTARGLAMALFRLKDMPVDLAGGRVEREYPLVIRDCSGRIQERYVDVVAESGGTVYAIDYKTDAVSTEEQISAAMDRYRFRQEEYGVALAQALGRTVSVWLALLAPGVLRKIGEYPPPGPCRLPTRT